MSYILLKSTHDRESVQDVIVKKEKIISMCLFKIIGPDEIFFSLIINIQDGLAKVNFNTEQEAREFLFFIVEDRQISDNIFISTKDFTKDRDNQDLRESHH